MRIVAGGSDPPGRLIAAARSKHLALNVTVRERCLRRACGSALAMGSDPQAILTIEKHISRIVEYSYEDKQHRTRKLQKL